MEGEENMRRKVSLGILYMVIIAIFMLVIPQIFYWQQVKEIINNIQIVESGLNSTSFHGAQSNMSLNEKIDMLEQIKKSVVTVTLETGNLFSLYEARKSCFNEMCKIPMIEMDIYGPVKDEINIEPVLYINGESPSQTMIVWRGSVLVNHITYSIILEEESGKILEIKAEELEIDSQELLLEQWKVYLNEELSEGKVI